MVSPTLIGGDCLAVLRDMDAESVDAVVTDPPYELSGDGKASASRVAAEFLFPQHPNLKASGGGECHLVRLMLKVAELCGTGAVPSPAPAVPVSAVALNEYASGGEIEVEDAGEAPALIADGDRPLGGDADQTEHLGDFYLELGDVETALNVLNRAGCGFASRGLGIGFRIAASRLPGFLRENGSVDFSNHDVRALDHALASFVGALGAAENEAVARFDLGGRLNDCLSASAALKLLAVALAAGAKLVRTGAGARSLPPVFQSHRVSVVDHATRRTLSFNLLIHKQTLAAKGFMGKEWDGSKIAFDVDFWREVLRVMKPGAHLLAFGAPRNYHRLTVAIEDAGFEVRDSIPYFHDGGGPALFWVFGSGFPKSLDVSKAIDKAAGIERGANPDFRNGPNTNPLSKGEGKFGGYPNTGKAPLDSGPATDAARQWQGWGTALKPAYEPIVLARKPLAERTVAENVLRYGTGAINVDACRVPGPPSGLKPYTRSVEQRESQAANHKQVTFSDHPAGRFPANLIHDGSEEVMDLFAAFGERKSGAVRAETQRGSFGKHGVYGKANGSGVGRAYPASEGSAARFFYCAKASKADRAGSKHPTVKPISLMQYLVRLITPPGGTVLDPFAGSGTTGEAARREGFASILIEREEEYQADIRRRFGLEIEAAE